MRCRKYLVTRSFDFLVLLCTSFVVLTISAPVNGLCQEQVVPEATPTADDSDAQSQSYLWWFLRSSGLIGLFILILSIYFVATVIRLFLEIKPEIAAPPELIGDCERMLDQGDVAAVYAAVRNDDSFIARVLTSGLAELSGGLSEARDAMERVGEMELVQLEKQISMLAVLGTLGPMIGLIGTLKGMISSFSVIATSDVQLKASEVAGGISEALLLTFEGVALSVPAIYFFAVFRNRVASIHISTMVTADQILRRVGRRVRHSAPKNSAGVPISDIAPPPLTKPGESKGMEPAVIK